MRIIQNIKYILDGVWHSLIFLFLNKETKAKIRERRAICKNCTYMSENYKKAGLYTSKRLDKHCGLCKCNIYLKTASLSSECGVREYNKKNNGKLKLKWLKIK